VPAIEVENLHKKYGDTIAVQDVSFTVQEGEIFGILGPNGAGKTTTVECVEGLRKPDGGHVRILGKDPIRNGKQLHEIVGVQLQEGQLPEKLRVGEAVKLYASLYENPADAQRLITDLGLADKRGTPYGKLSGGQKQRLSVALALIGNPRIAILDELTTGLDPQARRDTWQLIEDVRAKGVTILLVTHFMDEAERLCDRLAVIDKGRVIATDSPSGLVAGLRSEQRITFVPSRPFEPDLLGNLPEVSDVDASGSRASVTGTGNLVHVVTTTLAASDVIATDLRIEQANLEDAFVALTGRAIES
jgi:ABC-2 type transport system ATP-binding protein